MKLGLLGFGTVGAGVYHLVEHRTDLQVKYVLDLREIPELGGKLTHDFQTIVNDPEIDTVVEVLGGLHPSYEFVTQALRAGKNVVTANKYLVCRYFQELTELAARSAGTLRCTAAAGGGIPWLTNLERERRVDKLTSISGIMNGTTNFIMDAMLRTNAEFDDVLRQAQALGYAEADPSADIDGWDIQRKLVISANIAFDCLLNPEEVPVCGIRGVSAQDIRAFSSQGWVCKLMATALRQEGSVAAFVEPTLLSSAEPEAAVPSNFNFITLVGEVVGRLSFYGQGAGRYPTACNCVQDCLDLAAGTDAFYAPCSTPCQVDNSQQLHPYYVRTGRPDAWLRENTAAALGGGVLTRPVSVAAMHAWRAAQDDCFIAGVK